MITRDKKKRVFLTKCILPIEDYYIYWKQRVHSDGTLINIGYLYHQQRSCKGWSETLKNRILKKALGGKSGIVTQTTNRA